MNEVRLSVLREAWENPGPNPARHIRAMGRLKNEWPTLFDAVMGLLYPEDDEDNFLVKVSDPRKPEVIREEDITDFDAGYGLAIEELTEFLDDAIRRWRNIEREAGHDYQLFAPYYIDAFQSVRQSLIGAMLPMDREDLIEVKGDW